MEVFDERFGVLGWAVLSANSSIASRHRECLPRASEGLATANVSARALTRRLLDGAAAESGGRDNPALAARAVFERTHCALARALGPTGSNAIFARALTQVQAEHPLLQEFHIDSQAGPAPLDRVTAIAHVHGAPPLAAGLAAWVETVLDMLGDLVGVDVVSRLVEPRPSKRVYSDKEVK